METIIYEIIRGTPVKKDRLMKNIKLEIDEKYIKQLIPAPEGLQALIVDSDREMSLEPVPYYALIETYINIDNEAVLTTSVKPMIMISGDGELYPVCEANTYLGCFYKDQQGLMDTVFNEHIEFLESQDRMNKQEDR